MKPTRIQRRRTNGWRMPANTVYVGRPTKWGNPFHGKHLMVEECVEAYRALLLRDFRWFRRSGFCLWTAGAIFSWSLTSQTDVDLLLEPLRGKNLACWCPLDKPCHADILLELANQ